MKKKLFNFFSKRYIVMAFIVFFTFFITRHLYRNIPLNDAIDLLEKYDSNVYNLKQLPDGIITSIIGVTSTYDSLLISLPPPSRFHEFEVTIINPKTYTIYLVIVPLYAITAFKLGNPVLNGNEQEFIPKQPNFNYENKKKNFREFKNS